MKIWKSALESGWHYSIIKTIKEKIKKKADAYSVMMVNLDSVNLSALKKPYPYKEPKTVFIAES